MKKSRKRILSLLFALILLISNVGDLNLFAYASAGSAPAEEELLRVAGGTTYDIVGPADEVVRWSFRFYHYNGSSLTDDAFLDQGNYSPLPYAFTDANGDLKREQWVTRGERPLIPQADTRADAIFDGWYEGSSSSGTFQLAEEPFDFDNLPAPAEGQKTVQIDLYARYRPYAFVAFHQSEAADSAIAYVKRVELPDGVATLQGEDYEELTGGLFINHSGTGQEQLMGWRLGNASEILNKITLNPGQTDLYPVFKPYVVLNYIASRPGYAADYVPAETYFLGESRPEENLPVTTVADAVFDGWFTGENGTGTRVTNEYGVLVVTGETNSLGFLINEVGEMVVLQNMTLYAAWKPKTETSYRIMIWTQKADDDPALPENEKNYDLWDVRKPTASLLTSETVEITPTERAWLLSEVNSSAEYFVEGHDNGQQDLKADGSTVLNVYFDRTAAGFNAQPDNNPAGDGTLQGYTLHFADSLSPAVTMPADRSLLYVRKGNNAYTAVAGASAPVREGYEFKGWFLDEACTESALEHLTTMPGRDVTVYAKWEIEWYLVTLDPNYGALINFNNPEHPVSGDLEDVSRSTFMWKNRFGDYIQEYTQTRRDFVQSDAGTWYYVKHDNDYYGGTGDAPDGRDRSTWYTQDFLEVQDTGFYETFEFQYGAYLYDGWYEIKADGSEVPFNFNQPITHRTRLKLHWRKAGNYYLQYVPADGSLDTNASEAIRYLSEVGYTDGAEVLVLRSAKPSAALEADGYTFAGWQVRNDPSGALYGPGDILVLRSEYAERANGRDYIYLDAVYTKLPLARIDYDANGGSGSLTVEGLENNTVVTLSDGTGFSLSTNTNAKVIGWSESADYPLAGTMYDAGANYVVNKEEPTTLYAVWGVRVSYDLNAPGSAAVTWDLGESGIRQDAEGYYRNVPLNTPAVQPNTVPVCSDSRYLFYYWSAEKATPTNTTDAYDFSQPLTAEKTLYAYWSGPKSVTVKAAVGAQSGVTTLNKETHLDVGEAHVAPLPASIENNFVSSDYGFDIAVAYSRDATVLSDITEEDAIEYLYYNSADGKIWLHYKDRNRGEMPLSDTDCIWFLYHQKKPLNIGYCSVEADGAMIAVTASNPTVTDVALGEYDVQAKISQPFSGVGSDYQYFSYAVGTSGATSTADIRLITDYRSRSDSDRPELLVRNSWNGFRYSTNGGATWVNCGFDAQIYLIYYKWEPTLIRIWETTYGSVSGVNAPMNTEFTYDVYYIENGSKNKAFDFTLKSGESRTLVTYYKINGVVNTKELQVEQQANPGFVTTPYDASSEVSMYSYTPVSGVRQKTFTFLNYHKEIPVTVRVAVLEDGKISLLRNGSDPYGSGTVTVPLALLAGEGQKSTAFLTALRATDLFNEAGYSFSSIICGTDNGSVVNAVGLDVAAVAYEQVELPNGNDCEPVLYSASGGQVGILDPADVTGSLRVYYLYCKMPTIHYVYEGFTVDGNGYEQYTDIPPADAEGRLTNRGMTILLNKVNGVKVPVTQDAILTIPATGLAICQQVGDGYFQIPPELDDRSGGELYQRYLTYSAIGIRGKDGKVHTSNELKLYLRIHDGKLQYSFNNSDWSAATESPEIYAIYSMRGYELSIEKTVKTSDLPDDVDPTQFSAAYFTITVSSAGLVDGKPYVLEGGEVGSATANNHSLVLRIRDGETIRIKGLPQGTDYTVVEGDNESYTVTASGDEISQISNESGPVKGAFRVSMIRSRRMSLINTPNPICQIGEGETAEQFYSLNSAIDYAKTLSALTGSGVTIKMLENYSMPTSDTVRIESGWRITLDGNGKTIYRSTDLLNKAMFTNEGRLTITNLTLDGAWHGASAPMILQSQSLQGNVPELNVTRSNLINGNNSGNGGAIRATAGDVTVSGGTISGNTAANGGAIAFGGGTLTLAGAQISYNTADTSGGAIWAAGGTVVVDKLVEENVTVANGVIANNEALNGDGGAIYLGGDGGSALLNATAGASITDNKALKGNGSAVYVNSGSASFVGSQVTRNKAGAGYGAVAMLKAQSTLELSGNVKIIGNTNLDAEGSAQEANVWLGCDTEMVINDKGITNSASIGVYVPGLMNPPEGEESLFQKRGNVGKAFAYYDNTGDGAVAAFVNDRIGVGCTKETGRKLVWGSKIGVQVNTLDSFSTYPNKASNGVWSGTKKNNTPYNVYPTPGMTMSELAEQASVLAGLGGTYAFACAFYNGDDGKEADGSWGEWLTEIRWDNAARDWQLIYWDSVDDENGNPSHYCLYNAVNDKKLIVYFSKPVYLSIENNTEYTMTITGLTVNGKNIVTTTSPRNAGCGLVYAKDGVTEKTLLPIHTEDLTLAANSSIRLLIPGSAEMSFALTAGFPDVPDGADPIKFRHTKSKTDFSLSEAEFLSATEAASFSRSYELTKNVSSTYQLIFGEDRAICKVIPDAAWADNNTDFFSEKTEKDFCFSSLTSAFDFMTENNIPSATVGMLADYLMNESAAIPLNKSITLTTLIDGRIPHIEQDTWLVYPGADPARRATISRDAQNTKSLIAGDVAEGTTSLKVQNLVFDGKSVGGTTEGGMIKTKNINVTIENCEFRRCMAGYGGAIFIEFNNTAATNLENKQLTVTNSIFNGCESQLSKDRFGGGAIWTNAFFMWLEDCEFTNCKAAEQAGAVFHRIDKDNYAYKNDSTSVVRFCTFENCSAKAGGALEIDAYHTLLEGCTYKDCTATNRNGGGMNLYIQDYGNNNAATTLTVAGCFFDHCTTTTTGSASYNGGAFRSYAQKTNIVDCVFINSICSNNGGGAALNNSTNNANTTITRSLISGCTATSKGGGIYCDGPMTVSGGTRIVDSEGCVNYYSQYPAAIQAKLGTVNNSFKLDKYPVEVQQLEDGCVITGNKAAAGGGLYINGSKNLVVRDNVVITNNRLTSDNKEQCAGVYFNGSLTVGFDTVYLKAKYPDLSDDEINSLFESSVDYIWIYNNKAANDELSDLRLKESNGQNSNCVTVKCGLSGQIGVVNAKKAGTQFGTSAIKYPAGVNDYKPVLVADDGSLWGIINLSDTSSSTKGKKIIWAAPHLCKITDGDDNLLFFKTSEMSAPTPAIFDKLDDGSNTFTSAFSLLRLGESAAVFYTREGDEYKVYGADGQSGKDFKVKLLKDECAVNSPVVVNAGERQITLTTETVRYDSNDDILRFGYYGTKTEPKATLFNGGSAARLITVKSDLKLENIELDGRNVSTSSNGALCMVENAALTIGKKAELISGTTTGKGGGVYVGAGGSLNIIDGGSIGGAGKGCSAANGGCVYFDPQNAEATFLLNNGVIDHCTATADGGGIMVAGGRLVMNDSVITNCTAARGSAVMVNTVMIMHGGSIRSNKATEEYNAGGAAITVSNSDAKLYFSGKPTVTGNTGKQTTSGSGPAKFVKSNVLLNFDSNSIINVGDPDSADGSAEECGLSSGAYIGVRVTDGQFEEHGGKDDPFGHLANSAPSNALFSFANDENGFRGSLMEGEEPDTIYWKEVYALQVTKQIDGYDLDTDKTDSALSIWFHFRVTLDGSAVKDLVWDDPDGNGVKQNIVGDFTQDDLDHLGLALVSQDNTKMVFEFYLRHGLTLTVMNLPKPEGLTRTWYTVTEVQGENGSTADPETGAQYSPLKSSVSGSIGGVNGKQYISSVLFVNRSFVCKVTDVDRNLLYFTKDSKVYPAVYTSLAAAIADIKAHALSSNPSDMAHSQYSGKYHIEMLVPEYKVREEELIFESEVTPADGTETKTEVVPLAIPAGEDVTLTTALMGDGVHYPFTGVLNAATRKPFPAVIYRDFSGYSNELLQYADSLLTVSGKLTLMDIVLDGMKEADGAEAYTATSGGGLVYVSNSGVLKIEEDATLRNSRSAAGGGAVFVDKDGKVEMNNGTVRNNEAVNGGAFYLKEGGSGFVEMNGGTVEFNKAAKGGAFYLEQGGKAEDTWASLTVLGGTISDNSCDSGAGGAFYLEANSKLDLRGGTVQNNTGAKGGAAYVKGSVTMNVSNPADPLNLTENSSTSEGGAFYLDNGGLLDMSVGVITNNRSAKGGAVYVASGGVFTLSGGSITGNTSSGEGAGVYLAAGSKLTLSGKPDFGGPGTNSDGSIDSTVGNLRDGTLTSPTSGGPAPTNGKKSYTKARQDIYLEESQENPATLWVKGDLTGETNATKGAIWVWAEHEEHYKMRMPFAVLDGTVGETVGEIFRDAQIDELTLCGSEEYLYGVLGADPSYMYWSGGLDIYFKKVDGYGNPLGGAEFALYKTYAKALSNQSSDRVGVTVSDVPNQKKFTSEDHFETVVLVKDGPEVHYNVTFTTAPGIYYMREINTVPGYETNPFVYRVIVGESNIRNTLNATDAASALERADYIIQRVSITAAATDTNPAVDKEPDIYTYGIVNIAVAKRKVLMKNSDTAWRALRDGKFDILTCDLVPYWYYETVEGKKVAKTENSINCVAGSAGSFWIGMLPYGTYYLHQTREGASTTVDRWYEITIPDDASGTVRVLSGKPAGTP